MAEDNPGQYSNPLYDFFASGAAFISGGDQYLPDLLIILYDTPYFPGVTDQVQCVIPPLFSAVEKLVGFYWQFLSGEMPISNRATGPYRKGPWKDGPEEDIKRDFVSFFRFLTGYAEDFRFVERYKKGLLRDNQIRLVEIAIDRLLKRMIQMILEQEQQFVGKFVDQQLMMMVEKGFVTIHKASEFENQITEVAYYSENSSVGLRARAELTSYAVSNFRDSFPDGIPSCRQLQDSLESEYREIFRLVKRFILSERFRSERLEQLLLKHIDENGVNLDVVRGVREADIERSWRTGDFSLWGRQ
ncbi:hypothetical protein BJ508DRAFT_372203, partial [Ascobolus immersus RN42]